MNDKKALACYLPTTVILIDDDLAYLQNVRAELDKTIAAYKIFNDPVEAKEYINQHPQHDFVQKLVSQETDPDRGQRDININLAPLWEEVYNPERFEAISVIIADQEMPELKGLELLADIEDNAIKKILLTGMTSDKQAIEAFNKGVIDKFINKDTDNFQMVLQNAIEELLQQRTQEKTGIIVDNLAYPRPGYEPSPLTDPVFVDFLKKLIKEKQATEFYLFEENGSYVFFDFSGKPTWLTVRLDEEMESDYLAADEADTPVDPDIVEKLKNKSLIVQTFTKDELKSAPSQWKSKGMLHPAQKIEGGKQTYYYAYIENVNADGIDRDKLVSFRDYLER
jgi:CheY-like chemotaxis protein